MFFSKLPTILWINHISDFGNSFKASRRLSHLHAMSVWWERWSCNLNTIKRHEDTASQCLNNLIWGTWIRQHMINALGMKPDNLRNFKHDPSVMKLLQINFIVGGRKFCQQFCGIVSWIPRVVNGIEMACYNYSHRNPLRKHFKQTEIFAQPCWIDEVLPKITFSIIKSTNR